MNAATLTRALSALLLATAVLHVLAAVFGVASELKLPMIAFGLIYGALGVWVQTGGRLAVLVTVLVTLLGLTLGVLKAVKDGEAPALIMLVMLLIEIGVVGAGTAFLLKSKTAA